VKKKVLHAPRKLRIGVAIAAVASAASGAYFLISTNINKPFPVPAYEVLRVIDGDTFETKEKQHIRVASTEAPELDQCGGEEAKEALERLIINKPVYLKVTFRDPYQRLVSLVYADGKFINKEMLSSGYSYYARGTEGFSDDLREAGDVAREKKIGLFSDSCTQSVNKKKPRCNIKGNDRNGKIYYTTECGFYDNVTVQLYLGDRWFCSEKEAINAGFRKPEQCR